MTSKSSGLDNQLSDLASRRFADYKRRRDVEFGRRLESLQGEANRRGIFDSGFYLNDRTDAFLEELRVRTAELWRLLKEVLSASAAPFTDAMMGEVKRFVSDWVRGEGSELTERLRRDLSSNEASRHRLADITDAIPFIEDGLFAEIELFARQAALAEGSTSIVRPSAMPDPRKVFVVHGRDAEIRKDVFDFLMAVGLEPIEWSGAVRMTGKGSPYIGEVLDSAFARAQAVVVILTPDDEVRLTGSLLSPSDGPTEREIRLQPRPNVLFEAGMAFGHQPDRTILVEIGSPKPFSDVAGRHAVRLTNDRDRRQDLADRLKTAGCVVDVSGDKWQSVGDFEITRESSWASGASLLESGAHTIRYVDMDYPTDIGFVDRLKEEGFDVAWCGDSKLARRLDVDGWSLATSRARSGKEVIFKMHDMPEDKTLIKRRDGVDR
jgi:predicted nucleotide-binding protein